MSSVEKLFDRFRNKPKDFTWDELVRLLKHLGYEQLMGSGSRRRFVHEHRQPIILHQPHPRKILKTYQMNQIYETLKEEQWL